MEEKWKESRMLSLPATFTNLQRERCEMLSREDPMMEENIWSLSWMPLVYTTVPRQIPAWDRRQP